MDGSRLERYFDDGGLEAARIYKDKDGQIEYLFTAEYDGSGNVLKHLTFDSTGTLVRTDSFARNADGEWTEHLVTLKDGTLGRKFQKTFTPDGSIQREAEWAADGSLVKEELSQHDDAGNYTGCTHLDGSSEQHTKDGNGNSWSTMLDADGNITGRTEFRHDENGVQTGTYYYDAAGALLNWNEWIRNAQDQITKRTDYNADGTVDLSFKIFKILVHPGESHGQVSLRTGMLCQGGDGIVYLGYLMGIGGHGEQQIPMYMVVLCLTFQIRIGALAFADEIVEGVEADHGFFGDLFGIGVGVYIKYFHMDSLDFS